MAFARLGSILSGGVQVFVWILAAVAFAVAMFLFVLVAPGGPNRRDIEDANVVAKTITDTHHFEHNSISVPGRPPVFWHPGSRFIVMRPIELTIYDVIDKSEQDRIAAAVMGSVAKLHSKPAELRFFRQENWDQRDNVGTRLSELQMRCIRVTESGARDIDGQKLVSYH